MTERVKVLISNRQKDVKIPSGIRLLIRRCCHAVLIAENFHESAEISVSFVNNEQIRQLNAEYRQKDAPTDVLSFPLGSGGKYDRNMETGALQLGDIVISVEKAVEQARMYGHSLQREIGFSYVRFHGIFHDDMAVYREDEAGEPAFWFGYVDSLMDFLLSAGLIAFCLCSVTRF